MVFLTFMVFSCVKIQNFSLSSDDEYFRNFQSGFLMLLNDVQVFGGEEFICEFSDVEILHVYFCCDYGSSWNFCNFSNDSNDVEEIIIFCFTKFSGVISLFTHCV